MCPKCLKFHSPERICPHCKVKFSYTVSPTQSAVYLSSKNASTRSVLLPAQKKMTRTEFEVSTSSQLSPSVTTSEDTLFVALMTSMENIQLSSSQEKTRTTSQTNIVPTLSTDQLSPSTVSISSPPVSTYATPVPEVTALYGLAFQTWLNHVQALALMQPPIIINAYYLSEKEKIDGEIKEWLNSNAEFQQKNKSSLFDDILLCYMSAGRYFLINECLQKYPWLKKCIENPGTDQLLDAPITALQDGYHVLIHFNIYEIFNVYIRVMSQDSSPLILLMFQGGWYQLTIDDVCNLLRVLYKIFEKHQPVISLYTLQP